MAEKLILLVKKVALLGEMLGMDIRGSGELLK